MPASIVRSSSASESPQTDGRFWVTETHTFNDGSNQVFRFLADPGTDVAAIASARATQITTDLAAAAVAVPPQISALQARRAINAAGLRAAVEASVAAASADIQTLWYTADTIERADPNVIAMAAAVGLTSDQLDQLFRQAAEL